MLIFDNVKDINDIYKYIQSDSNPEYNFNYLECIYSFSKYLVRENMTQDPIIVNYAKNIEKAFKIDEVESIYELTIIIGILINNNYLRKSRIYFISDIKINDMRYKYFELNGDLLHKKSMRQEAIISYQKAINIIRSKFGNESLLINEINDKIQIPKKESIIYFIKSIW